MAEEATPVKWYDTPLFKQVVGYALAAVLIYLSVRFGIQPATTPVEIKLPPEMLTKEVHYHTHIEPTDRPSVKQKE